MSEKLKDLPRSPKLEAWLAQFETRVCTPDDIRAMPSDLYQELLAEITAWVVDQKAKQNLELSGQGESS